MNPFEMKAPKMEKVYAEMQSLYAKPYDKDTVDPYTKCRIILMNGTEFEAVKHSHAIQRMIGNNDIRRALACVRRSEQQQQKRLSCLKPLNESVLEHTISYEQLAVDLTAWLAQHETDRNLVKALNFALLEDFDHLYRYANLLEMVSGIAAKSLVGGQTEIMPARPTVAHHRHPVDSVKIPAKGKSASSVTKMHASIITAAEQQTMNYYMNIAGFGNMSWIARENRSDIPGNGIWSTEATKAHYADMARRLYQEIGMVEEDHVTRYGSLLDTEIGMLECNLMHEYTECYLYYSCMQTETDPRIKKIWEMHFNEELAHLAEARRLLQTYEKKDFGEVLGDGTFPEVLVLKSNTPYVRKVLKGTVNLTDCKEDYCKVETVGEDSDFVRYQRKVVRNKGRMASHEVIEGHIAAFGTDYRFETAPHPIRSLKDRKTDNVVLGTADGVKV